MKRSIRTLLAALMLWSATILPAMGEPSAQAEVIAVYDRSSGMVEISGRAGAAEGARVAVQVRGPQNRLDYMDQGLTGPGGTFRFRYMPAEHEPGTYRVVIGGEAAAETASASFSLAAGSAAAEELRAALSPEQPHGSGGWYVTPVTVTLQAAGVDAGAPLEYRVNQGQWQSYGAPFTLGTDGEHRIEFRHTGGEAENARLYSASVKLDTTAPVTTAQITPSADPAAEGRSPSLTIRLQAEDNLSVTRSVYRIDGGPWSDYSHPVTAAVYGSGRFEYRSFDEAGNTEEVRSLVQGAGQPAAQAPAADTPVLRLRVVTDPAILRPADGRMIPVTASVYGEHESGLHSLSLESITADVPLPEEDIEGASIGAFDPSFLLRAVPGRRYLITYTALDAAGRQVRGSVDLVVPSMPDASREPGSAPAAPMAERVEGGRIR
ncbi:OmpL47-type beta-barrel domain-containing protein [Paenibacillus caseinilyticus]|uniref:Uncharacterized protein n=1 Tax=Paenibacillus mucilaginosus K02 TaxID=997761 RepID=I0BLH2_9BACL|nr:hypothetical protein [Paenibacillus mucilaginosus]AFH63219.2 hypothetical protein B2K_21360 [Paenibacillus mucilaginosus K02]